MPIDGVLSQVSDEERHLRTQLAAAFRLVAHYGWDDIVFTHQTTRLPGQEHHFLINPYQLCFDEICASNLVKIDLDGNKLGESPYIVNQAGFVIHSAIHAAREDANAVVHLHTPQGQAVSAQACGLLPVTQTAMTVCHDVAYHDYEGIAFDLDERERLARDLGDKHALILRNHGTLTVGETVADAFMRMYFLERACQAQIMAQAGGELNQASAKSIETTATIATQGLVPLGRGLAWPALLRKLDRIDASYQH